jgi:cytochrome c553
MPDATIRHVDLPWHLLKHWGQSTSKTQVQDSSQSRPNVVNIKFLVFFAVLFGGQAVVAQPAKQPPADFQTTLWAVSCMACHGTDGKAEGVGLSLHGRTSQDLTDTLLAYKSGKKSGTIMDQHAKGYSDDELRRIALYFSQIK